MPMRKIFEVIHISPAIVASEMAIEIRMCVIGGSPTSVRTNMVSGPNTGASENATVSVESGLVMIAAMRNHGSIMIIVMGMISCCASFSELQAAPPIAYAVTYVKYAITKKTTK